jgi:HEAT repeat protein
MPLARFTLDLDALGAAQSLLLGIAGIGLLAGVLAWLGILGWLVGLVQSAVHAIIRAGFALWRRLLGWAPWPVLLLLIVALLAAGAEEEPERPGAALACGLGLVVIGVSACLAYVHLDLERYEVARGYKALHSPLRGQALARDLLAYGHRASAPLLAVATVAIVSGFALTNYGLYHTVARGWYQLSDGQRSGEPGFSDFLAYSLISLYNVVDLLHIASSYQYVHVSYVRQARWPAATLLTLYKTFFTFVLLQQVFASVRRGKLLSETVSDFWSPMPPLRERAEIALPQFGPSAVRPLLLALGSVEVLTAEQQERLPYVLAGIGPATIPHLVRHLHDPGVNVRAVVVAALGQLHASEAIVDLVGLRDDPDGRVRESLATALGDIGSAAPLPRRPRVRRARPFSDHWFWQVLRRRTVLADPVTLMVEALRGLLADPVPAVRRESATALGRIGPAAAAPAAAELAARLDDADEEVRCRSAEALGRAGGLPADTLTALVRLLVEPNARLRVAAAHALGAMKADAASAVPTLVPLLHSDDEAVREAAAEAVGRIGVLPDAACATLTHSLENGDSAAKARTAEALGTIGPAAADAAPALAEALTDGSDRVRAKAAQALGQIGEGAAGAVPSLVRALRDQDTWVSALAAEALGEMGDSAAAAVPALVRSLRHTNPRVRANAAEALAKLGATAATGRAALEAALLDPEDNVRVAVLATLGEIGGLGPDGRQRVLSATEDANPEVRAAAITALGKQDELQSEAGPVLLKALHDPNPNVRLQAAAALPRLQDVAMVDELSRLLEDPDRAVQLQTARALGQFGPAAAGAGSALARAAAAGEVELRVEALRAVAQIQPLEAAIAFRSGLRDAEPEVRKLASAGLILLAEVPPDVVPELIEALRDPETRVRANAARVLLRIDPLPPDALPALKDCTRDADDGVRLNAARVLRSAPPGEAREEFTRLLEDSNSRLRLLAAGSLLAMDPTNESAAAVVVATLRLAPTGIRRDAIELIASLGPNGKQFRTVLADQAAEEVDPELSGRLGEVLDGLEEPAVAVAE